MRVSALITPCVSVVPALRLTVPALRLMCCDSMVAVPAASTRVVAPLRTSWLSAFIAIFEPVSFSSPVCVSGELGTGFSTAVRPTCQALSSTRPSVPFPFALEAEREQGLSTREAIYQACLLRFRPSMMTTMVALLGGLPLALGQGVGSELRRPLGIAIVGGLLVSQLLTLFTTPVMYLALDRFSRRERVAAPAAAR